MKLLLKIMYDGTNYSGYQAQYDRPSVQTTLTEAFSKCMGRRCTVTGCSRTDAGVHALGFVIMVEPYGEHESDWLTIPVGKVHRALSQYLPDDISVIGESVAGDDFHPRYCDVEKTYVYKMYDTSFENPFYVNKAWHLKKPLTEDAISSMNEAAAVLVGKHDFSSFMAAGSKITDAVRTVKNLSVERSSDGLVELSVSADGFLYNMVRIITGTLVDVGMGSISKDSVKSILESCDRKNAGRTAPAYGLYLKEVRYDKEINWLCD